jgi:hypothetical protein
MASVITHLRWQGKAACNCKGIPVTAKPAAFVSPLWGESNPKCKRCVKLAEKLRAKSPEAFESPAEKPEPVGRAVNPQAPESSPTSATYNPLQLAYDTFNTYLFKGALPDCLLTLQQKGDRVIAYYRPQAFKHKTEEGKFTDEIAFNPVHLNRDDKLTLSTLLHEAVHLWRNMQPKPSRRGYHDKLWAAKMVELGLKPQNCDHPERQTGHKVTHEAIPGGQFEHLAADMIKGGWHLSWAESSPSMLEGGEKKPKAKKKQTRAKYTCPCCEQNAWAKHGASLKCGECDEEMQVAE